MIDIHAHILPGVDDGSDSLETSIALLQEEIRNGVTTVVATPHYCPLRGFTCSVEELTEAHRLLCEEVQKRQLPITVLLGQEIYSSDLDAVADKLDEGRLLTLNGSRFVLLEFSMIKQPDNLLELLYTLSVRGYQVIVAHPERYRWMNRAIAARMKEEGCLFQMNAASYYSFSMGYRCRCRWLLHEGQIDMVAGDIHQNRTLPMARLRHKLNDDRLFDVTRLGFTV